MISTCYKNRNIDLFSQHDIEKAVALIYEGDKDGNKIPTKDEINLIQLEGDGDFASKECIEFLKQADIVVTNPPFSLFREYVALLEKYDKKFLIIGNKNAITYKEIFPLIAKNKVWLGITSPDEFDTPEGVVTKKVKGLCRWYTNLEHQKRHEKLILVKKYKGNENNYPKYDNYNAINVDKVSDIPMDYYGVMGVPITFLDKYNPEQFEIVAFRKDDEGNDYLYSFRTNEIEILGVDKEDREEKRREENGRPVRRCHQTNYQWQEYLQKNSHSHDLEISSQAMIEQAFRVNWSMQEYLSDYALSDEKSASKYPFATSIGGIIKNAEGKIGGKITYARITIRKKLYKNENRTYRNYNKRTCRRLPR